MATKARPFKVKAADDGEGIIEALVATYATDSVGDRIVPGAFKKSLEEWASGDNLVPFIWSHQHADLNAYLGDVLEAKETDEGLWIKAQIDMDDPHSRKAYRLIKGGRIKNYSFAYDVLDEGPGDDEVNELRQLKLYEVGPTLIGANQETRTLAVKNDDTKEDPPPAGDGEDEGEQVVLKGSQVQALRKVRDLLTELLDGDAAAGDTEEHAQPAGPAKDETARRKSEEPNPTSPVEDLLTHIAIYEQEC